MCCCAKSGQLYVSAAMLCSQQPSSSRTSHSLVAKAADPLCLGVQLFHDFCFILFKRMKFKKTIIRRFNPFLGYSIPIKYLQLLLRVCSTGCVIFRGNNASQNKIIVCYIFVQYFSCLSTITQFDS